MAKVKVFELARELSSDSKEIKSKDILDFLKEKNVDVKVAQSSIEDERVIAMVKERFGERLPKPAKSKPEALPAKEALPGADAKPEAKPKKKRITSVFNPHHSKTGIARPKAKGERGLRLFGNKSKEREEPRAEPKEAPEEVKKEAPIASQELKLPLEPKVAEEPKVEAPRPSKQRPPEPGNAEKPGSAGPRPERAEERPTRDGEVRPLRRDRDRPQGQDRPYVNRDGKPISRDKDGRPLVNRDGSRPPVSRDKDGRPLVNRDGSRPPARRDGEKPPGQGRPSGSRPPIRRDSDGRPLVNRDGSRPPVRRDGDRPQGQDRRPPVRRDGDRPQGQDRPYARRDGNRPQGQGRPYENRDGRPTYQGNRPPGRPGAGGPRPGGPRPGGSRDGQRPDRGRPGGGGYKNRLDQEINKMNQGGPAATPEDSRSKESREHRRGSSQKSEKHHKQNQARSEFGHKKQERFTSLEKNAYKKRKPQQPAPAPKEEVIKTLVLPERLTVKELAEKMKVQPSALVKKLFLQGTMLTVNQEIEYEQAEEIAMEYNFITEQEVKVDIIEELLKEDEEDVGKMVKRPPIVVVMGHVDHGKTSVLDAIRDTNVTGRESGGITQHIGAYMVKHGGEKITFLDTPGHEAFTSMRMRGANATDIAILVVAADDGVMPQTIEAINHAKAAGVEVIVAINKMDKPDANVDRVKQELSEHELVPEDWGGSTVVVPVSARTREGIDHLLEMVLLTAELMELKANPKRLARGLVIEAQLDKGRGAVATILVQKGTLKISQTIAAGSTSGKVRAMLDDKGKHIREAGPSTPVEILGLNNVPHAGEVFVATETDKEAKSFADTFISHGREKLLEDTKARMSLDDLFTQIKSGNIKELGVIVKADVQGSVEAVKQSLLKLSNEEVAVKIVHSGVGAINESDVNLAIASNAIIIGFHVSPDAQARVSAEREQVDIRLYEVIYKAIEDIEAAMKGMLDPIYEEKVLGHAEVRQIFKASGIGNIAGCFVLDGIFQRNCKVRISREGKQTFEGNLASLKRFKDDVKEVKAGYECGLVFEGFNDIQELDIVEAYTMVEVPR